MPHSPKLTQMYPVPLYATYAGVRVIQVYDWLKSPSIQTSPVVSLRSLALRFPCAAWFGPHDILTLQPVGCWHCKVTDRVHDCWKCYASVTFPTFRLSAAMLCKSCTWCVTHKYRFTAGATTPTVNLSIGLRPFAFAKRSFYICTIPGACNIIINANNIFISMQSAHTKAC